MWKGRSVFRGKATSEKGKPFLDTANIDSAHDELVDFSLLQRDRVEH